MSSQTEDFAEALARLQVRIVDTLAGYDEIHKKCEPEIAPLTADFIAAHETHEKALSQRLVALGREPDADGSFFSTVQRLVIKTRAVFDDIDDDILPSVVDGEERVLELYDDAIRTAIEPSDRTMLDQQRGEIQSLTTRARAMAD